MNYYPDPPDKHKLLLAALFFALVAVALIIRYCGG
jgi:hypothetical protein